MAILILTGASLTKYDFDVDPGGKNLPAVAGVYYVSARTEKEEGGYLHNYIYIGESENVAERFNGHHKEDCFTQHNANCVNVHPDDDNQSRLDKEADLVAAYNPPCND